MTEIAVYGLPVRMPHWSFGARYIYQLVQRHMGYSRLFEVVFPGNPGHAYLASSNASGRQHPGDCARARACGLLAATTCCSAAARSRSASTSSSMPPATRARSSATSKPTVSRRSSRCSMPRCRSSSTSTSISRCGASAIRSTWRPPRAGGGRCLSGALQRARCERRARAMQPRKLRAPVPPHPERDLLWFIASYAPEMESWERDIFLAVREESFYFYPVYATQIMNEGWASYWHARLLREADFIPQAAYLDAIKCHSDVVRPIAAGEQVALAINPVSSGLHAVGADRRAVRHRGGAAHHAPGRRFQLRPQSTHARAGAASMGLFRYRRQDNGQIKVGAEDIDVLRESLLLEQIQLRGAADFGGRAAQRRHAGAAAREPDRRPRPGRRARAPGARIRAAGLAPAGAAR